jgi:hypothetical protein
MGPQRGHRPTIWVPDGVLDHLLARETALARPNMPLLDRFSAPSCGGHAKEYGVGEGDGIGRAVAGYPKGARGAWFLLWRVGTCSGATNKRAVLRIRRHDS